MKMVRVLTVSIFTMVGSAAFAGTFSGDYQLAQECSLSLEGQSITIPAGLLTISENIPVSEGLGTNYRAILLQAGGAAAPVVTLGIGVVQPFVFGPQAYSVGAYSESNLEFVVNYVNPTASGEAMLVETIRLLSSGTGTDLIAVDETTHQKTSCSFGRKF